MARILVTGLAGGLAQLVVSKLLGDGHEVTGVDYRTVASRWPGVMVYRANYNKTLIEDIFKNHKPEIVLHLGRVGNLKESIQKRYDLNVVGSQKIMNLCVSHGTTRLIVLSTFHIYGADPSNHTPISEEDPLRAGLKFPEIADAIQLDNMAATWVYRHPEVSTSVLRCTNVVGPRINNTMSRVLRYNRVAHIMGFNPMVQFIHEEDLSDAIIIAAQKPVVGVFNVAGPGALPWKSALRLAKTSTVAVPGIFANAYVGFKSGFPQYLLNFFKYPCVITDRAFREATGWAPGIDMQETLWSTVAETRDRDKRIRGY